jgi:hypothetical protein
VRKAVYIVGGIAAGLALIASVLIVMFGLVFLDSVSGPDKRIGLAVILIAVVHLAVPITGIVLARRAHVGVGLAVVIVSLLLSLGLVLMLPALIGAAAQ